MALAVLIHRNAHMGPFTGPFKEAVRATRCVAPRVAWRRTGCDHVHTLHARALAGVEMEARLAAKLATQCVALAVSLKEPLRSH